MSNVSFSDTDSNIVFSGAWSGNLVLSNPVTGPAVNYRFANDLTAQFVFTFPEPATAFYYFGFQRSKGGHYLGCVDCDPQNPQFTDIDALNVDDDGRHPPVVLFSKTFSSPGIHTVIIRNTNDVRFNASQITIASLVLTIPDGNSPATSSPAPQPPPSNQPQQTQQNPSTPSQASTNGQAPATTNSQQSSPNSAIFSAITIPSGGSSSSTAPAAQSSTSNSQTGSAASSLTTSTPTNKSSSSAGAIAGGVVGGIAALAAVLILLWFFRRQRGKGTGASREAFSYPPSMHPTTHGGFIQTGGVIAGGAAGSPVLRGPGGQQMGQYPFYQNSYPGQQQYPVQGPHAQQQFHPQQYQSHPAAMNSPGPAVDPFQGQEQAYQGGGVYPVALPTTAAAQGAFTYTTTATSSSAASGSFSPTSEHGGATSDSGVTASSGQVYGTGEVKNPQLFHQVSVSTTTTASSGGNAPIRRVVQNQELRSPTVTEITVDIPEERNHAVVPPAYDQLFTGGMHVAPVH